jgi:hypothetical protein
MSFFSEECTTMENTVIKFFRYRVAQLLLLAAMIMLLLAESGLAQESRNDAWILPKHYPAHFSGHGCINRMEDDEVVIDDQFFRLATDATFHTRKSQYSSRSPFRKGVQVGFSCNSNKKIESLWYIDKCR